MRYLDTEGFTSELTQLIKSAKSQLIIVSPYLKFGDRIKELIEHRSDLTIFIIYGKKDPAPAVVQWIQSMKHIKWYFVKNLHAKCYMNERTCVIGSMNLYEFSIQNNYEMGVVFTHAEHPQEFARVLKDVKMIKQMAVKKHADESPEQTKVIDAEYSKLSTSKLADKLNLSTSNLRSRLLEMGFLAADGDSDQTLTPKAIAAGAETRKRYGKEYWLWPVSILENQ